MSDDSDNEAQLLRLLARLITTWATGKLKKIQRTPVTFDEHEAGAADFMMKLREIIQDGSIPEKFTDVVCAGLLHGAATWALEMGRRVLEDDIPQGVRSQLMAFDQAGSLVMWRSSSRQSFTSISNPWIFEGMDDPSRAKHEGICVRAFSTLVTQVMPTMEGETVRGEPIGGMVAHPITTRVMAQHGDIAVLNVV